MSISISTTVNSAYLLSIHNGGVERDTNIQKEIYKGNRNTSSTDCCNTDTFILPNSWM